MRSSRLRGTLLPSSVAQIDRDRLESFPCGMQKFRRSCLSTRRGLRRRPCRICSGSKSRSRPTSPTRSTTELAATVFGEWSDDSAAIFRRSPWRRPPRGDRVEPPLAEFPKFVKQTRRRAVAFGSVGTARRDIAKPRRCGANDRATNARRKPPGARRARQGSRAGALFLPRLQYFSYNQRYSRARRRSPVSPIIQHIDGELRRKRADDVNHAVTASP